MAEPGKRNPLRRAEVIAKARDAIARARIEMGKGDEPNAELIITKAFHEGATAVELYKAARE